MPVKQDTGARGAVLISGRDITRRVKRYSTNQRIAIEDSTGLQPPGDAVECIQGLEGGAASVGAMLPVNKQLVEAEMQVALGIDREAQTFLGAPWGLTPGYLAEFFEIHQSRMNTEGITPNITSYSADFEATGGLKRGSMLHTSRGSDIAVLNAIFDLILDEVTGPGDFVFADTLDGVGGTVTIAPADSTATVKAAIEALAGYGTVNVTGAGSTALYGADVATGSTANAESVNGANAAANAIDDNNGTQWNATGATAWLKLQLAAPATIGMLRIYSPGVGAGPEDFTVEGSNTGAFAGEEDTLLTVVGNVPPVAAGWMEFVLDVFASYAYIRINVSAMAGGGNVAIYEMELLPLTPSSGNYQVEVTAPAGYEIAVPTTADAGYSAELLQEGHPDIEDLLIIDAIGNGTSLDNGEATNDGGFVIIDVPYASYDLSATVRLAHADDVAGSPGAFSSLATFAVITVRGSQYVVIPRGTTIKQWTRIEVTALTGEFAYAAALARNPIVA